MVWRVGLGLGISLSIALQWSCTTTVPPMASQDPMAALLSQCRTEFQQRQVERALETASRAIVFSPTNPEPWNARGFIYSTQGAREQAIRDFTEAVRLDPQQPLYRGNLGAVYLESGRYRQALDAFNDALRLGPPRHDSSTIVGKPFAISLS